jgi:hypothetical protein
MDAAKVAIARSEMARGVGLVRGADKRRQLGARTAELLGVRVPLNHRTALTGSGKRRRVWDRGAFLC